MTFSCPTPGCSYSAKTKGAITYSSGYMRTQTAVCRPTAIAIETEGLVALGPPIPLQPEPSHLRPRASWIAWTNLCSMLTPVIVDMVERQKTRVGYIAAWTLASLSVMRKDLVSQVCFPSEIVLALNGRITRRCSRNGASCTGAHTFSGRVFGAAHTQPRCDQMVSSVGMAAHRGLLNHG